MLFIFYAYVYTFLYHVLEINAFSLNNENEINYSLNDSKMENENGSIMSKHKSLLHIISKPSEAPNLKSNIFDKMLSNEMLSIKQQLFEKNESSGPPFYITFKNSIPRPTLELNQRWPIGKSVYQDNGNRKTNLSNINTTYVNNGSSALKNNRNDSNDIIKLNNSIQSKVLEVRSFDEIPISNLKSSNNHHNHHSTKRHCTCMKTNPDLTCTFRCSNHRNNICTHTENYVTSESLCTRNVNTTSSLAYYPYYIYPTMFLGVTTESSYIYYHPDVFNELKIPKRKHPHSKKPSVDNIYLESDENEYDGEDYLENVNSEKKNPNTEKYIENKYEKSKTKSSKKIKTVYNVDFKDESSTPEADKSNEDYLQVLDKDKFVEDIVQDLKVYYSDAVIKDCYCSFSSFEFGTKNWILYMLTLSTPFML